MSITTIPLTTVSDLKTTVRRLFKAKLIPMIKGSPGIGKSAIVKDIAGEYGELFDLRPAHHGPEDFKFPLIDIKDKNEPIRWIQSVFPTDPKWKGVIFLDEFNQAPAQVQAALLGLMHSDERMIGKYKLPEGALLVAATNNDSDRSGGNKQISPVSSRVCQLSFQPDCSRGGDKNFMDEWADWLLGQELPAAIDIVSFLMFQPTNLLNFNAGRLEDSPTPRGWHMLAKVLEKEIQDTDNFIVQGFVGPSAATGFSAHRKMAIKIDPLDILKNPDTPPNFENGISLAWSTVCAVASVTKAAKQTGDTKEDGSNREKHIDLCNRAFRWLKNVKTEYAIVAQKIIKLNIVNNGFERVSFGDMQIFNEYPSFAKKHGSKIVALDAKA